MISVEEIDQEDEDINSITDSASNKRQLDSEESEEQPRKKSTNGAPLPSQFHEGEEHNEEENSIVTDDSASSNRQLDVEARNTL
jgi:hypothetical protein